MTTTNHQYPSCNSCGESTRFITAVVHAPTQLTFWVVPQTPSVILDLVVDTDRAGYEVRDVLALLRPGVQSRHLGDSIGLINNHYRHLNKYGFVKHYTVRLTVNRFTWTKSFYMLRRRWIRQLVFNGMELEKFVMGRHQGVNQEYPAIIVDWHDVSLKQVVAAATAWPFWKTMTNRAPHGSQHATSVVPLINFRQFYAGTR